MCPTPAMYWVELNAQVRLSYDQLANCHGSTNISNCQINLGNDLQGFHSE